MLKMQQLTVKLSHQHSRQAARVGRGSLHYAAHSECTCSSTVTETATMAQQPQCQTFKSNNQPVMIALLKSKTWHWEYNSAASKRATKKTTDSCIGKMHSATAAAKQKQG